MSASRTKRRIPARPSLTSTTVMSTIGRFSMSMRNGVRFVVRMSIRRNRSWRSVKIPINTRRLPTWESNTSAFESTAIGLSVATRAAQPQKADQRNDYLTEENLNLGLILNRLRREPSVKKRLL